MSSSKSGSVSDAGASFCPRPLLLGRSLAAAVGSSPVELVEVWLEFLAGDGGDLGLVSPEARVLADASVFPPPAVGRGGAGIESQRGVLPGLFSLLVGQVRVRLPGVAAQDPPPPGAGQTLGLGATLGLVVSDVDGQPGLGGPDAVGPRPIARLESVGLTDRGLVRSQCAFSCESDSVRSIARLRPMLASWGLVAGRGGAAGLPWRRWSRGSASPCWSSSSRRAMSGPGRGRGLCPGGRRHGRLVSATTLKSCTSSRIQATRAVAPAAGPQAHAVQGEGGAVLAAEGAFSGWKTDARS